MRHPSVRSPRLALVAVFGALTLAAGCSSSSNGTPSSPTSDGGGVSSAPQTGGGIGSLPPTTGETSSSDGGGDASAAKFCSDFANVDPSDFTSGGGNLSAALKIYDKLVADAPADIKDDVTLIRDLIKSSTSGGPSASAVQKLQSALTHIGTYAASHCAGS